MALRNNFSKLDYREGIVRTSLDCHACNKVFIAKLNYDIDGDHRIICPNCGHKHYRQIKKGVVTTSRWEERPNEPEFIDVMTEKIWKDDALQMTTTSVEAHIRERFLK